MSTASKRRAKGGRGGAAAIVIWVLTRIVLPLALLYGLLWWRADAMLREQIDAVRPFMDVQRGITVLGLNGDIGVRNLRLSPATGTGLPALTVRAERAVVQTPGLLWLARTSLLGLPNELPSRLGLSLSGTRIEGSPDAMAAALGGGHVIFPFDLEGCETGMSLAVAQALGLDKAPSDFSMTLLNDRSGTLRVNLDSLTSGLAAASAEVVLQMGSSGDAAMQLAGSSLRSITVVFEDRGFVAGRNDYCGRKLGLDPDQFVAHHLKAVQARFAADGLVPGAAMTQAYAGFSRNGGSLRVQAVPLRPGPMAQLAGVKLDSLNLFFDASVKHDDNFSAPLVFLPAAQVAAAPDVGASAEVPAAGSTVPTTPAAPAASAAPATAADLAVLPGGTIEYAQLPAFIGREIEVDTTIGTRRRGVLTGASSISLVIKLAPADGGFAMSMPKNTIASVRLASSTSDAPESQANAQAQ